MMVWRTLSVIVFVNMFIAQTGCTGIGDACGEDVSNLPHTIVECDEGVCVDGVCVESRNEGESCKDGDTFYACSDYTMSCKFSFKRDGFFCLKDKKIHEFCDVLDGDERCLFYGKCERDELLYEDSDAFQACPADVYCVNNKCQKSKNEGSACYIGHEFSCLKGFNCVPGNMSVSIPIDAETLESIDRTNGVCKVYAKLGEPCDVQSFIKCEDGLVCGQGDRCKEID
jgi:hypothetical protein